MFGGTLGRVAQRKSAQLVSAIVSQSSNSSHNMSRGALVTFSWRPVDGGSDPPPSLVQIAGTFTSWQPVDMLAPPPQSTETVAAPSLGYWTLDRHLEPGVHQYKYVVDGTWIHDEKKDTMENEMGSKNNVIRIEDYPGSEKLSEGLDDDNVDGDSVSSLPSDEGANLDDVEDDGWEVLDKPLSNSNHSSIEMIENSRSGSKASTSPRKPPSLEVERKFVVPSDYKDRLMEAGFQPVDQFCEILADSYYDFSTVDNSFPLLTNDHWLRQRNGDWELKYPVSTANSMSSSTVSEELPDGVDNPTGNNRHGTTLYHETSNLEDIVGKIRSIVAPSLLKHRPVSPSSSDSLQDLDLNSMVASRTLTSFATLETNRKWFKRQDDNVSVVVDETDWGYMIGEIEVMIETKDDVSEALTKIDHLASNLEFTRLDLISFRT